MVKFTNIGCILFIETILDKEIYNMYTSFFSKNIDDIIHMK